MRNAEIHVPARVVKMRSVLSLAITLYVLVYRDMKAIHL